MSSALLHLCLTLPQCNQLINWVKWCGAVMHGNLIRINYAEWWVLKYLAINISWHKHFLNTFNLFYLKKDRWKLSSMSLMRTLIRYVYLIKINFMYSVSFGDVLLLNIPPTQFKVFIQNRCRFTTDFHLGPLTSIQMSILECRIYICWENYQTFQIKYKTFPFPVCASAISKYF